AHYGKAYKLFESEKYDEAFEVYKKCTELKSDYYDAWYQCGLCKYRKALALNPKILILSGPRPEVSIWAVRANFGDVVWVGILLPSPMYWN
ncbi:MAG: tetratricopeptide repeat protein, partial [Bacteroidales bacterium]|nr:tetratricopeptide repeat protein [Bacteroidales bacterium]